MPNNSQILNGNNKKLNQSSLLQKCKLIIQEMNEEIQNLTCLNENSKEQNSKLDLENSELRKQNIKLKEQNYKLNEKNKYTEQNLKTIEHKNQQYQINCTNMDKQYKILENKYKELQIIYHQQQQQKIKQNINIEIIRQQIEQFYKEKNIKQKINQYQKIKIQLEKQKIKYSQFYSKYQQCFEQNIKMSCKINQINQYNQNLQQKYQSLKIIVQCIAQKNKQYHQLEEIRDQQTMISLKQLTNTIENKLMPQQSRLLKTMNKSHEKINSFRIQQQQFIRNQTTNKIRKTNKVTNYFKEEQHHTPNTKQPVMVNPELAQQLLNIKQQISDQYGKIQCKKQRLKQQRVSKTINSIQQQLNRMLKKAQHSDSDSIAYI